MDDAFDPAPHLCSDLACRRSAVCRRPFASACLTSPSNDQVQRQRIVETLHRFLREEGIDPDGPPPADALPIEETLKLIREEAARRRAKRMSVVGRHSPRHRRG